MRSNVFWFLQLMEIASYMFEQLPDDYRARYAFSFTEFLDAYSRSLCYMTLEEIEDMENESQYCN